MQGRDRYKEVRVLEYPNGITRVHIPALTEEERARRMKQIHDAAAALLLAQERSKRNGNIRTAGADGAPGPGSGCV